MAELLHILAEQYDYPQLTDEVLRYEVMTTTAISEPGLIFLQGPEQQRVQQQRYSRPEVCLSLLRQAVRAGTALDHQTNDFVDQAIGQRGMANNLMSDRC